MMRRKGQFGAILFIVIVVIVMIGGIIFLGRMVMGNNKPATTSTNKTSQNILIDLADKTSIQMSVRGPIVAREKHYQIETNISNNARQLYIYQGYEKSKEIKKIELDNDKAAFRDFATALDRAGLLSSTKGIARDAGACANGQLIDYRVVVGDKVKYETWTTSCGNAGNFNGQSSAVIDLILKQIPGARDEISKVQRSL